MAAKKRTGTADSMERKSEKFGRKAATYADKAKAEKAYKAMNASAPAKYKAALEKKKKDFMAEKQKIKAKAKKKSKKK